MGPRDTDIHPHKVKGVGEDLEAESRHARQRLRHSLDSSDTVHDNHTHGGWTSAAEAETCAHAWETHMIDLVKEMGSLGEKLRDSAKGYQDTDHFAEGLMHGMRDLGRS